MKNVKTGEIYYEGGVSETFEALENVEIGSPEAEERDIGYLSQVGPNLRRQFRLDSLRPEKLKQRQEQEAWEEHRRVAFVTSDNYVFYSIAGHFRSQPPVSLPSSGIVQSDYPDAGLLECWIPLVRIDA